MNVCVLCEDKGIVFECMMNKFVYVTFHVTEVTQILLCFIRSE